MKKIYWALVMLVAGLVAFFIGYYVESIAQKKPEIQKEEVSQSEKALKKHREDMSKSIEATIAHIKLEKEKKHKEYLEHLRFADGKELSVFTTSLEGRDSEGRVANIELANSKIDGLVLMPGDEFSFNETVGNSNIAEDGWKLAAVIVNKKFVQGYGGGICQVSSTLYNSLVGVNVQIKERHAHSKDVGYVPLGTDATIAYPYLDFKFVNTLDFPIRIEASVIGNKEVVKIIELPNESDFK